MHDSATDQLLSKLQRTLDSEESLRVQVRSLQTKVDTVLQRKRRLIGKLEGHGITGEYMATALANNTSRYMQIQPQLADRLMEWGIDPSKRIVFSPHAVDGPRGENTGEFGVFDNEGPHIRHFRQTLSDGSDHRVSIRMPAISGTCGMGPLMEFANVEACVEYTKYYFCGYGDDNRVRRLLDERVTRDEVDQVQKSVSLTEDELVHWRNQEKSDVTFRGLLSKFMKNDAAGDALLSTGHAHLLLEGPDQDDASATQWTLMLVRGQLRDMRALRCSNK